MTPLDILTRRRLLVGSAGVSLVGLGGCATALSTAPNSVPFAERRPQTAPVHARMDRVFDITVCLRPFRAQGPRLESVRFRHTHTRHA